MSTTGLYVFVQFYGCTQGVEGVGGGDLCTLDTFLVAFVFALQISSHNISFFLWRN